MKDALKNSMLRVVADSNEMDDMKDYLGIKMPDHVIEVVNDVVNLVDHDMERAMANFGSEVSVRAVEAYLKENGYPSWEFWNEVSECFSHSVDREKLKSIFIKYAPK